MVAGTVSLLLGAACAHGTNQPQEGTGMYTVLVTARFKSADPAVNKKAHDDVASATQQLAISRGDVNHKVLVDPADPRAFVAIDVWKDLEGIKMHFSDPRFLDGAATIFEGPPTVRIFKTMPGGTRWGELNPTPGTLLVTVQAPLAGSDDQANVLAHNRVAEGGRETAQKLGDIAHLPYLAHDDSKQFMAIDLWTNPDGLKAFMSNPQAQQAFGSMFAGPPKVTVYAASDYHAW